MTRPWSAIVPPINSQQLTVGGYRVTGQQMLMLLLLAKIPPGGVASFERLGVALWPGGYPGTDMQCHLGVVASHLRRTLGLFEVNIQCIRGEGYFLAPKEPTS